LKPRSAAAAGSDFPYTSSTTCYIEVHEDGQVTHGTDREAYERAVAGKSRLYAVWPGQWSSHLFEIDDLDEYARAHGIKHDAVRTGLTEHTHVVQWTENSTEQNPRSQYVSIDVTLTCGCSVKDRRVFAEQMREQKGWDLAVTGGWGSHTSSEGTAYTFRVRRKSLGS
jgi:hypothetical protein